MSINSDEICLAYLYCEYWQSKMKVIACLIVALFCLAAANAKHVKVVGEIENHKFIDRQWVYAPAERSDYLYKGFTFPEVG